MRILYNSNSRIFKQILTSFNIACEFIPVKFRGWILLTKWNGNNVGVLFPNLIILKTIHAPSGLPKALYLCSLVILFCIVFASILYIDSLRNYIINKRYGEAFRILANMKIH